MLMILKKRETALFALCLLIFSGLFCHADQKTRESTLDSSKYITTDEIQPGMDAYCLTIYEGTKIEKFDLKVLSVVRNIMPGRDAILVQGTDERFIHTGPVAGCSGSPVYIDGRMAGALAFGWLFSKDALYGVTPIKEILKVSDERKSEAVNFAFDYSSPINFTKIYEQIRTGRSFLSDSTGLESKPQNKTFGIPAALPSPLVASGLSTEACEQLGSMVEPFGFMLVSGASGIGSGNSSTDGSKKENIPLVPGSCLALPLVSGDISMEVIGTVTEVDGDKVYAFGHSFLGYGPIDVPMATGKIHTVVSSVMHSFKFGTSVEVVGALTADESTATLGRIGAKARTIPLTIKIDRYNDADRQYDCRIVDNKFYTPRMLYVSVVSAALTRGSLPPDHAIEYKVAIGLKDAEPIVFENVSTTLGLKEVIAESIGSIALIMNNPYEKVDVESIDFDIRIVPKSIASHIWSVGLSDSKVKAGQRVDVSVVIESVLAGKKKYEFDLKIPDELAPGKYKLVVLGGYGYKGFVAKAAPYKFVPQNLETLIDAINNVLAIKKDSLYCLLILPTGGISVEKAELPDLPATKALILGSAKRTLRTQPYQHWLEKSLQIGTVVVDEETMEIVVEE